MCSGEGVKCDGVEVRLRKSLCTTACANVRYVLTCTPIHAGTSEHLYKD